MSTATPSSLLQLQQPAATNGQQAASMASRGAEQRAPAASRAAASTAAALAAYGHQRGPLPKEKMALLKRSFHKSIVQNSDMNTELQSEAVDFIISAIDKFEGNYEAAARLVKQNMDRKFGPTWHCIIGEGYGFEVTYQVNSMCFVYYLGNVATLLFKN